MTLDSKYSLIIWDGKSKGSYSNIIRAIDNNQKAKVYLTEMNDFIPQDEVNKEGIDFIYRKNNGYTASEVLSYLQTELKETFNRTQELNKFLLNRLIIKKENNVYTDSRNNCILYCIVCICIKHIDQINIFEKVCFCVVSINFNFCSF